MCGPGWFEGDDEGRATTRLVSCMLDVHLKKPSDRIARTEDPPLGAEYAGSGLVRSHAVEGDWMGSVQRSRSMMGLRGVICAVRAEVRRGVKSGL